LLDATIELIYHPGMTAPALSGIRHNGPTVPPTAQQPHLDVDVAPPMEHGRPWLRWLVTIVILALLAAGGYWLFLHRAAGDTAAGGAKGGGNRAVPVVTARAVSGDLPIYLTGLGTVTPLNNVTVRSRVDGELIEVNFVEGQEVIEGQKIAQIDPKPFDAQIEQAKGQLAKDKAAQANAAADVERYTKAGASVSEQQLQTAKASMQQFTGMVQADQGVLDNAELQRKYSTIKAPISGRIGLRVVDRGNIVHATDTTGLAVIAQVKPITVVFALPQDDIPKLTRRLRDVEKAPDPKPIIAVDAFDRDFRRKLAAGQVLAVDNQVDPNSGTIRIKAQFANEDESLSPGQFVNARLLVNVLRSATLVPPAAVQRGPDNSSFVYVVQNDTVEVRNVKLGPTEADRVVIEEGLKSGEIVATDGVDKLQAGTKVKGQLGKWKGATRPSGEMGEEGGDSTSRPSTRSSTRPTRGEGARGRGGEGEKNQSHNPPLTPSPTPPLSPTSEGNR
jgi:multidrug efflux system membrane fusion protein